MNRIHIKSFGLARGLTAALLYPGCVMVMKLTILRMDISITETVPGLLQTFMIAWLTGASIASIYNVALNRRIKKE